MGLPGQPGSFLDNPQVRIALPGYLNDAAKLMKRFGQGQRIEALETLINRAAEVAGPTGKEVLVGAARIVGVQDAKNILTGGDTSVTQFFVERTLVPLGQKSLPTVTQTTSQAGLAQQYNAFDGEAAGFGLCSGRTAQALGSP